MAFHKILPYILRPTSDSVRALLFIVRDSWEGRRDGRDIAGEWGGAGCGRYRNHCFCTLPLSRCFASSEKPVDIMFLKL